MLKKLSPTHPGEVLLEEFMKPHGLSAYRLAKDLCIPRNRITEIVNEERDISAETALLLGHYFAIDPAFFMNLQRHYDLEMAKRKIGRVLHQFPVIAPSHLEGL